MELKAPTALVTGISGFIGSRLAARLTGCGWHVHGVVRPGSDVRRVRLLAPRATLHEFDGSVEALVRLASALRPDAGFHLAALFLASHAPHDVPRLVEANVALTAMFGEALARAGTGRLVYAGTAWQCYRGERYNPVALYAATKQAGEDLLRFHAETTGLRVASLRLYDTYGPGDTRAKIFNLLRDAALAGGRLRMSGGEQSVDLVHVDDVVEAFVGAERLLRERPEAMSAWGVSSGRPVTLRELAATWSRVSGRPLEVEWGALPYRAREMFQPWEAGPPLPGWSPAFGLEEGVRQAFAAAAAAREQQ